MSAGTVVDVDKTRAAFIAAAPTMVGLKVDANAAVAADSAIYTIAEWGNYVDDSIASLVGKVFEHTASILVLQTGGNEIADFTGTVGIISVYDNTAGGITQIDAPLNPAHGDQFSIKNIRQDATPFNVDANGATSIENPITGIYAAIVNFNAPAIHAVWQYSSGLDAWVSV